MDSSENIVVYNTGEIELKVSLENDTIWLTQKQIAELFDKDVRTINDHIKKIYKDEELYENSTIRKFRIVQKEGNREVSRDVNHYIIKHLSFKIQNYFKWFGFSKMDSESLSILGRLK